jgi:hypothetical protein
MDQRLHVGRTMTRPLWFWLGLLGSCWLPAFALAQSIGTSSPTTTSSTTGGLSVQLKLVGSTPYTSGALRHTQIGKTQCDAKVDLTFIVSGLASGTSSPRYLEILKGTNCYTMESKDGIGNDDCVRIKYVNRRQNVTLEQFTIPITDLCGAEGAVTLWFLPVDTLDTSAAITPYGVYEVPLDTIAPIAPVNVRGGAGETQISVNWERSDSNISLNYVIWDPKPITTTVAADAGLITEAGTDASGAEAAGSSAVDNSDDGGVTDTGTSACSSSLMAPGETIDPANLPKGLFKKTARGDVESFILSGSDINSPRAAVAIVAEDLAGNVSVLSNIACVSVVDTTGFWDAYKQNGGDADGGCACSLPGSRLTAAGHTAGGPLAALALLGLAVMRVRRKRLT